MAIEVEKTGSFYKIKNLAVDTMYLTEEEALELLAQLTEKLK